VSVGVKGHDKHGNLDLFTAGQGCYASGDASRSAASLVALRPRPALRQAFDLVRRGGTVVRVGRLGTDDAPPPANPLMAHRVQLQAGS